MKKGELSKIVTVKMSKSDLDKLISLIKDTDFNCEIVEINGNHYILKLT